LNRQNAKHAARAAKGNAQKNNMMRTMCATYFLAAHIVRIAFWRFKKRSFFSTTASAVYLISVVKLMFEMVL
jgi:hypothetical protein